MVPKSNISYNTIKKNKTLERFFPKEEAKKEDTAKKDRV